MGELLLGGGVALGAGVLTWYVRARRLRILAVERLNEPVAEVREVAEVIDTTPALPRATWLPPLVAVVVSVGLWLAFALPPVFCVATGILVLVLGILLEVNLFEGRCLRLEGQLADAIDMVVGALGAGAGATDAMRSAAREAPRPQDRELNNLTARRGLRGPGAPRAARDLRALRLHPGGARGDRRQPDQHLVHRRPHHP
jgi:tight adherence protein B